MTQIYTTIEAPVQAIHHIVTRNVTTDETISEYRNFYYEFNPVIEDAAEVFQIPAVCLETTNLGE